MKTYVMNMPAGQRNASVLCGKITELYPDFSVDEVKKYGDSLEMAKLSDGKNHIAAELDTSSGQVTLASDIYLNKLTETFADLAEVHSDAVWEKRRRVSKRAGKAEKRRFNWQRFAKYAAVPLSLLIYAAVLNYTEPFFMILAVLALIGGLICVIAVFAGWLCLLPVIPLALLSTYSKSELLTKTAVTAMPVFGAVYFSRFFILTGENVGITQILTDLSEYPEQLIVYVIATVYVMLLPAMIIDDICQHRRFVIHGKRTSAEKSLIGWGISAAAMAAVVLMSSAVAYSAEINEHSIERKQYDADMLYRFTVEEKYSLYEDKLKPIAEYAVSHNCGDWSECPDESLEQEWLWFTEEGILPELDIDEDTVEFWVREGERIRISLTSEVTENV